MNTTLTRWFVITGAPCSGKTTVINELQRRGYRCAPEVARAVIDARLAEGISVAQMRADEAVFQRSLIDAKVALEEQLDPQELVFMDRAMPDSITYLKMKGIDADDVTQLSKRFRYAHVFQFERLPLLADGARVEDDERSAFLEQQLELDYSGLGYAVERVPVMSIDDRIALVLSRVDLKH